MSRRFSLYKLLALLAAGCSLCWAQSQYPGQQAPAQKASTRIRPVGLVSGVPLSAQSKISAAMGSEISSYLVESRGEGLRVQNPRQQLAADFTADAVTVNHGSERWVMSFQSYGYGEARQSVARVVPDLRLNRVEYRRGSLTEWYVNGPLGLEQGFTLSEPPGEAQGKPLAIALALSGDLKALAEPKRRGLILSKNAVKPELQYAGLAAYDATGKELPSSLELRGSELLLKVQDAGARYPVTVDPWVQLAELTASDGASGDFMGISVGISGQTVVVGAPGATVGANAGQGAAYIFVKPPSGWANMTETAKLTASDGQAGDGFGGAVGIAGNTIVVGACPQSGVCNGPGKVYVFQRPKGGWKTTSKFKAELTASDGVATDGFGNEMSISGDGSTVVVGAASATVKGQTDVGAVYIFVKPNGGWKTAAETAKLTESKPKAYDDFCCVSVSADGSTVFVGALQFDFPDNTPTGPGKAYIFIRPAGGWKSTSKAQAKLTASDGVSGDWFGFCQAGSTCLSGDGTTVLATAPAANSFAGKGYVYVEPPGGWATTSKFDAELTPSDGQTILLGWSAAITDGTAVLGAVAGSNGGAAYVVTKPKSGWKTTSKFEAELIPGDGFNGDDFAFSVGISGNTIVVGAPTGGSGAGTAYVFGK